MFKKSNENVVLIESCDEKIRMQKTLLKDYTRSVEYNMQHFSSGFTELKGIQESLVQYLIDLYQTEKQRSKLKDDKIKDLQNQLDRSRKSFNASYGKRRDFNNAWGRHSGEKKYEETEHIHWGLHPLDISNSKDDPRLWDHHDIARRDTYKYNSDSGRNHDNYDRQRRSFREGQCEDNARNSGANENRAVVVNDNHQNSNFYKDGAHPDSRRENTYKQVSEKHIDPNVKKRLITIQDYQAKVIPETVSKPNNSENLLTIDTVDTMKNTDIEADILMREKLLEELKKTEEEDLKSTQGKMQVDEKNKDTSPLDTKEEKCIDNLVPKQEGTKTQLKQNINLKNSTKDSYTKDKVEKSLKKNAAVVKLKPLELRDRKVENMKCKILLENIKTTNKENITGKGDKNSKSDTKIDETGTQRHSTEKYVKNTEQDSNKIDVKCREKSTEKNKTGKKKSSETEREKATKETYMEKPEKKVKESLEKQKKKIKEDLKQKSVEKLDGKLTEKLKQKSPEKTKKSDIKPANKLNSAKDRRKSVVSDKESKKNKEKSIENKIDNKYYNTRENIPGKKSQSPKFQKIHNIVKEVGNKVITDPSQLDSIENEATAKNENSPRKIDNLSELQLMRAVSSILPPGQQEAYVREEVVDPHGTMMTLDPLSSRENSFNGMNVSKHSTPSEESNKRPKRKSRRIIYDEDSSEPVRKRWKSEAPNKNSDTRVLRSSSRQNEESAQTNAPLLQGNSPPAVTLLHDGDIPVLHITENELFSSEQINILQDDLMLSSFEHSGDDASPEQKTPATSSIPSQPATSPTKRKRKVIFKML